MAARRIRSGDFSRDLLTVFFGLGVFTANSAFRFRQWSDGSLQGWRAERKGYLTEEMFGYALAVFAMMRGESSPAWGQFLEGSVKTYFKNALKYFEKTGEGAKLRNILGVELGAVANKTS